MYSEIKCILCLGKRKKTILYTWGQDSLILLSLILLLPPSPSTEVKVLLGILSDVHSSDEKPSIACLRFL